MEFVAARVEAGPRRDAILRRHFAWELFKILTVDFLRLGEEAQRELCQGVAQLVDDYLTEPIRHGLVVRRRLPLALAQAGELPLLRQVVRQVVDEVTPPLVLDGDRVFMAYAGFFDRPASIGEDCYEVIGGGFTGRISERLRLTSLAWADGAASPELTVRMHLDMAPRAAGDPRALPVRAEAVRVGPGRDDAPGSEPELPVHVETADDHRSSRLSLRIPVDQLAQASGGRRATWGVRLLVDVAGDTYRVPVPAGPGRLPRRHWWHGRRPFGVSVGHAKQPRLQLLVEPVRLSAVLRRGRALMSAIRRK
jgi:hypothetical protein